MKVDYFPSKQFYFSALIEIKKAPQKRVHFQIAKDVLGSLDAIWFKSGQNYKMEQLRVFKLRF